jgi:hypothetical protein
VFGRPSRPAPIPPPPSRVAWALEAELYGHSPLETISYLSWCDDYESQQRAMQSAPSSVISPEVEPRWWRRLLG